MNGLGGATLGTPFRFSVLPTALLFVSASMYVLTLSGLHCKQKRVWVSRLNRESGIRQRMPLQVFIVSTGSYVDEYRTLACTHTQESHNDFSCHFPTLLHLFSCPFTPSRPPFRFDEYTISLGKYEQEAAVADEPTRDSVRQNGLDQLRAVPDEIGTEGRFSPFADPISVYDSMIRIATGRHGT